MSPRVPYLQKTEDKPQGKEAYLRRIASLRRNVRDGNATAATNDAPATSSGELDYWSEREARTKWRSVIRTVYKWSVRLVLVGMLVVLVGTVLYYWGPWSNPGSTPVDFEPAPSMTAKGSDRVAQSIAQSWAEDARLISLSATWAAGQSFQDGEGDWSLLYYSPTKTATALISVDNGHATLVGTHGVAQPIDVSLNKDWNIDSNEAIDQLRAVGGDDFLLAQPDATISLSLDLSRDAVWSARIIDQMSRRVFAVRVSSDSGRIIDIQQTG